MPSSAPSASRALTSELNGYVARELRTVGQGADRYSRLFGAAGRGGRPWLEYAAVTAVQALQAAREAGLHLQVEGEDLVLEAASSPPASFIDLLKQHKAEVVGLLRQELGIWSATDWRAFYDERAGIAEYDGGLSRAEAEALAYAGCVAEWLDQNPVGSSADRCLHCGGPDHSGEPLVPFGI